MNETRWSWLHGEVNHWQLKSCVGDARGYLANIPDDDIDKLWVELRNLLHQYIDAYLNPKNNPQHRVPIGLADVDTPTGFSPIHPKYSENDFILFAHLNNHAPIIDFVQKHTYLTIGSICALKDAVFGKPDAALYTMDCVNKTARHNADAKRRDTNKRNSKKPRQPNPWKQPFRNEILTLARDGFTKYLVSEAYKKLTIFADNNDGQLKGKSLPSIQTMYNWHKEIPQ